MALNIGTQTVREEPSDLLLIHAAELATCSGAPRGDACRDSDGPRRGAAMGDIGIIRDGAIAVRSGVIVDVGATQEVLSREPLCEPLQGLPSCASSAPGVPHVIDASGCTVLPDSDAHTHLVFAGTLPRARDALGEPALISCRRRRFIDAYIDRSASSRNWSRAQ